MKHQSIAHEWGVVIFLIKRFSRPVLVEKKAEVFELLQTDLTFPHCQLRFSILTLIFYERICRIRLLIA